MHPTKCQWIAKFVSHFLPIGVNMVRRTQWRENYCPRCKQCDETHTHLFHCQHPQSQLLFRKALDAISDWMTSQSTPDSLILEILGLITEWRQYGKVVTPHALFSFPIRAQLQLGWFHFMEGRLTVAFASFMQEYYDKRKIKKTGIKWTSGFITKMWTHLYWPQWTNRNEFVHKLNVEAVQSRRREELESEVQELYRSEKQINLLQKDQHLLSMPPDSLLELPDAQLQAWVNQFEVAVLERNRIFIPENELSSTHLRRWLLSSSSKLHSTNRRVRPCSRYRKISPLVRELRKRSTRFKR